jgi:predicted nucleic acid-binding protein
MSMIRPPNAKKVVFDTNVYIAAIQGGPDARASQLLLAALPRTYLSAVVGQELLTGAADTVGERLVERFVQRTEQTGRVITPTYEEWKEAGRVLARIRRREPAQRSRISRLVNDTLLALSARQIGATLYTFDRDDFTLIARYTRFALEML